MTNSNNFPLVFGEPFGVVTATADSESVTIDEPTITADSPASIPAPAEGLTVSESSAAVDGTASIPAPAESVTVSEPTITADSPASIPAPAESVTVSEPTITTDLYSSGFPLVFDDALAAEATATADNETVTLSEPTITADAPASIPAPAEGLTVSESTVASVTPAPGRIRPPAARLRLAEPSVRAPVITTLTRWLLTTIYREWPDESTPPPPLDEDAVVRINRDDPEVLETGERSLSFDLTVGATISAGIDDTSHTPEGTTPTYETEEMATIRITSLHERQGGTVGSHADHRRLVDSVLQALDVARSYPDVVLTDRARQPVRLSLFIGDVAHSSNSHSDHYETTIPVRLRGKLDPDT